MITSTRVPRTRSVAALPRPTARPIVSVTDGTTASAASTSAMYGPRGSRGTGNRRRPQNAVPGGYQSGGYQSQFQNMQSGGMNLAQLQQLAQTNPSALTTQQWAMLQAAGTVPSTLPYSSASQLSTAAPTTDTSAAPASSFDLSADYAGIPLWGWLAGGGLILFLVMNKKGR